MVSYTVEFCILCLLMQIKKAMWHWIAEYFKIWFLPARTCCKGRGRTQTSITGIVKLTNIHTQEWSWPTVGTALICSRIYIKKTSQNLTTPPCAFYVIFLILSSSEDRPTQKSKCMIFCCIFHLISFNDHSKLDTVLRYCL